MLCIFLYSCKEDEPELLPGAASIEYFYPMKTGNYWVYEVITDLMGNPVTQDTLIDTVRIVGTFTANGHTYYDFRSHNVFAGFYADSAGYIVRYDTTGSTSYVFLDTTPHATLWQDTTDMGLLYRVYRSGNGDTSVTVPAGTFTCLQTILDAHYLQSNPPAPHANPRPVYWYYAHGVGLVQENTWYLHNPGDRTKVLIDYHLEP